MLFRTLFMNDIAYTEIECFRLFNSYEKRTDVKNDKLHSTRKQNV